jgi:DNA-binding CsgD family transcriptional regulator
MESLTFLAELSYVEGQHAAARRLWQEARPLAEALGQHRFIVRIDIYAGLLANLEGDQQQAVLAWRCGLRLARELEIPQYTLICLAGLAGVLGHCGRATRAAQLLSLSAAVWQAGAWDTMWPEFAAAYEPALAATQAALEAAAFAQAWAAGQALSLEQATAEALAVAHEVLAAPAHPTAAAPTSPAPFPDGLTAREVEVLRLLATGHSSREMAATLVISEATVTRHITNLYAKIGARSRADATAYAYQHQLVPTATLPPA